MEVVKNELKGRVRFSHSVILDVSKAFLLTKTNTAFRFSHVPAERGHFPQMLLGSV